jgi:hypothetical protein
VRPLEQVPKGPSPLRRSSSAEAGQYQTAAHCKNGPVSQPASTRLKPSSLSTPPSSQNIEQTSRCKSNQRRETKNTEQRSALAGDASLKERRAAFAAVQSFVPQSKAFKRTSLAITAAQREIVRAAARVKEEAIRERYKELCICTTI